MEDEECGRTTLESSSNYASQTFTHRSLLLCSSPLSPKDKGERRIRRAARANLGWYMARKKRQSLIGVGWPNIKGHFTNFPSPNLPPDFPSNKSPGQRKTPAISGVNPNKLLLHFSIPGYNYMHRKSTFKIEIERANLLFTLISNHNCTQTLFFNGSSA